MKSGARDPTIADWGELKFLRWVRALAGKTGPEIPLSIGDDAAHLHIRRRELIVTTDALIEGTHFKFDWISPRDLGHKSLAVNLSDLAAMGARPVAAFLSLGVPSSTQIADIKDFFRGLHREGLRYFCPLAGGDLVRSPQWTINLTLIGVPQTHSRVIRRGGAIFGQTLYVTGCPGESGAGLHALQRGDAKPDLIRRHIRPTPRLAEAGALARICPDLAMIDVSDGIVNDAGQLARENKVSIRILPSRLPLSQDLKRYASRSRHHAEDWALYGGEDYELLFTTRQPIEAIRRAFRKAGLDTPVTAIGQTLRARGAPRVFLADEHGKTLPSADRTFRHFA